MSYKKGHKPHPPKPETIRRRALKKLGIDPNRIALATLDGRTLPARRAREVVLTIERDLGGSDQLSEGERLLLQRAAVLTAIIEGYETEWFEGKPVDFPVLMMLHNGQRRALQAIGLKRVPRDVSPTLDDIAREHNAREVEADAE
jgi:hypothetical protein